MKMAIMTIPTVQDLYIAKLQELVSGEVQLTAFLAWLSEMAPSAVLKSAFLRWGKETRAHGDQLQSVLQNYGADPISRSDQTIRTLAVESVKMLEMAESNELREVILIASVRKFEHYYIAAYDSAAALAGQLGLRADQQVLEDILAQVKKADDALRQLA
jgi:ferritin-like metal-binding protein YciE